MTLVRHPIGWIHDHQVAKADAAIQRLGVVMDGPASDERTRQQTSRRKLRWAAVSESWREPARWGRWGRVRRFVWAVTGGRISRRSHAYRMRVLSCYGRPGGKAACPSLLATEHGDYCGDCGCGERKIARLDGPRGKLTYRRLECPRAMPGFANADLTIKET